MKNQMMNVLSLTLIALVSGVALEAKAATTGQIVLSGSVAAATAITVTGAAGYNTLDLSTSQTDLVVADIVEINNTSLGYKVTMASANSGALKNGAVGSLTYTAKYNGTAATLSSTAVVVTNAAASSTVVNSSKQLKISYTGAPANSMMVGNYTDTLTFTIAAN
jgi:hypothetical protein